MSRAEAFEAKYIPEPNSGCWLWVGAISERGYGRFRFNGKSAIASRVSWALHQGSVPAGVHVLHRCDVPSCVNPDHLFLGTDADNVADMLAKGRERPWQRGITHCNRGHEFTDANTYRRNGQRLCRACRLAAVHRYQARAALKGAQP